MCVLVISLFSEKDGHTDSLTLSTFRLAYRCLPTLCLEEKNNQWLNFSHIEFEFAGTIFLQWYEQCRAMRLFSILEGLELGTHPCSSQMMHLYLFISDFRVSISVIESASIQKKIPCILHTKKCIPKSLVMYAWASFLVWVLLLFRAVINQQQLMAHYHDYSWLPI